MRPDSPNPSVELGRSLVLGSLALGNLSTWKQLQIANLAERREYVAEHGRQGQAHDGYQRLLVAQKAIEAAIAAIEHFERVGAE